MATPPTYNCGSAPVTDVQTGIDAARILLSTSEHGTGLGFTIQNIALGSGVDNKKLQVTLSRVLTTAEQTHLGLTT